MEDLLKRIEMGAKIVILCNSHNPTGNCLLQDELLTVKFRAYLIIDEAYYEFCGVALGFSEATSNSNLFTLRTMPKFYSITD